MRARKRKTHRPWTNEDTLLLMKYMEGSDINRKSIQEDILWDAGKFVKIHGNGKYGLLVGALEDRYDYYWISNDTTGQGIKKITKLGKLDIDLIENNINLSIRNSHYLFN